MQVESNPPGVLTVTDLRSFFHDTVQHVVNQHEISANAGTVSYLAKLLTDYARADVLFDRTADGMVRQPLAMIYKAAVETDSPRHRRLLLQRLGDLALFVAGLFSGSLRRSLVDVDYYVSMGSNAYGHLWESGPGSSDLPSRNAVFGELANQFIDFVDVLADVGDGLQTREKNDLWRLYEIWLKTGSRRVERLLSEMGVTPQHLSLAH